jgi:hypothetical protein
MTTFMDLDVLVSESISACAVLRSGRPHQHAIN